MNIRQIKLEWRKTAADNGFPAWLKNCGIEMIILLLVLSAIIIIPHMPDTVPFAGFLKRCSFYELTGYSCPSCGMTRGSSALFQGNFIAAFKFNPFIYLLAGFLFYRLFQRILETFLKKYPVFTNIPLLFYALLFSSYILFGVLRIVFEAKGT